MAAYALAFASIRASIILERTNHAGDTRGGMTPFMAHKQFGDTYKWMLYGDDDTLFFMTGGLIMVFAFIIWHPLGKRRLPTTTGPQRVTATGYVVLTLVPQITAAPFRSTV